MKKVIALILALFLSLNFVVLAFAIDEDYPIDSEVIEEYAYTRSVNVSLSISNSGVASIGVTCIAYTGVTRISAITYLEKWNGATWVRAYINGASQISASQNGNTLSRDYSTTIGNGKYRATTVFTVTNGTSETITQRSSSVVY